MSEEKKEIFIVSAKSKLNGRTVDFDAYECKQTALDAAKVVERIPIVTDVRIRPINLILDTKSTGDA